MNEANDEKIERLLQDAIRGLPLRRAPDALQRRVLHELELRATLPWWRRNFAQWPMAARVAFLVVCVALAGLSLTSGVTQHVGAETWVWARPAIGEMAAIGGAVTWAVSLVPAPLLYAALIVGAALYALLFGIGAFAYRTLYLQHSNPVQNSSSAMIRS